MGSCVSRGAAPASSAATTAKVVDMDGSMAQFAAPVTASEALSAAAIVSTRFFLCSSDELRFEAPPRALGADEPLQPGWLYLALPLPMLRRPLSGQEMAALAVKAASALADGGGKQRRKAGRVAPLEREPEGLSPRVRQIRRRRRRDGGEERCWMQKPQRSSSCSCWSAEAGRHFGGQRL